MARTHASRIVSAKAGAIQSITSMTAQRVAWDDLYCPECCASQSKPVMAIDCAANTSRSRLADPDNAVKHVNSWVSKVNYETFFRRDHLPSAHDTNGNNPESGL